MSKKIIISSFAIILASIFFVVNDAIINYLAPLDIKFYHFIFYGTPAYLSVPIYLLFVKKLKLNIKAKNYYIPLLRGILFIPMPLISFVALKYVIEAPNLLSFSSACLSKNLLLSILESMNSFS